MSRLPYFELKKVCPIAGAALGAIVAIAYVIELTHTFGWPNEPLEWIVVFVEIVTAAIVCGILGAFVAEIIEVVSWWR